MDKSRRSKPPGRGYSHIFMDTYARCRRMGFGRPMQKDGWVIFQKIVKFWQMDGLEHQNRKILVDGRVLSTKFWQIGGFENKNQYFDGLSRKFWQMEEWVGQALNRAYVSAQIPSTLPPGTGTQSLFINNQTHNHQHMQHSSLCRTHNVKKGSLFGSPDVFRLRKEPINSLSCVRTYVRAYVRACVPVLQP